MSRLIGIDFGTTNSVVATLGADGAVTTARYPAGQTELDVFRSVLCFWDDEARGRRTLRHAAGPLAVESYLDDPLDSRLIMSMKTYLAQPSFTQTTIFGAPFTLERMIGLFLTALTGTEDTGAPDPASRVVAGRPVRFAGATPDDALGETRLRAAFAQAGFSAIDVALEPEAAGYRFMRGLDAAATVLIGDFGGGTSDFSILRFDPRATRRVTRLGFAGVGIAGDTFDFRIIDNAIAPLLGKGGTYSVMGAALPVPPEYFAGFARWHRLSLMRAPRTLRAIREVAAASTHPDRLGALVRLIEDEQGYRLYHAVSTVKAALSSAESARLQFAHGDFVIDRAIARHEFEAWIAADLRQIATAADQAMAAAGLQPAAIDRVFLTGGTAFVPAVRALFQQRFGMAKLAGGGEFVSVAEGLALIARDRAERDSA